MTAEEAANEIARRAEAFRGAIAIVRDHIGEPDPRDHDLMDADKGLQRLSELLTPFVDPQWR